MKDKQKFLEVALEATQKATYLISSEIQKELKVEFKGSTDLVTNADLKAEEIIMETISSYFPEHRILAEESGEIVSDSEYIWVWRSAV